MIWISVVAAVVAVVATVVAVAEAVAVRDLLDIANDRCYALEGRTEQVEQRARSADEMACQALDKLDDHIAGLDPHKPPARKAAPAKKAPAKKAAPPAGKKA